MEENAAAASVKLSRGDVEWLDQALEHMELSDVFGGSPMAKKTQ